MNRSDYYLSIGLAAIIFFGLLSLLEIDYNYTRMHEKAHVEINEYVGIPSNMSIQFHPFFLSFSGKTTAYNITEDQWNKVRFLHSLNEIIGYNVRSIYESIIYLSVMISFSIIIGAAIIKDWGD